MGEWWEFIRSDFMVSLAELSVKDFYDPAAVMLWLILLFLPLTGVERRNRVAAMTYMLYAASVAILLILAIPQNDPNLSAFPTHIAYVLAFVTVTLYRWYNRHDSFIVRSKEALQPKDFEEVEK